MAKRIAKKESKESGSCCCWHHSHCGNGIYGLGFLGSAVYYISTATGFWMGVLGVLKAMVWPAFLIYGALKFLGM